MVSQKVVIKNPTGLHLRPAGILCKEAMQFKSHITFRYRENTANAKSVLSVLGACIKSGDEIELVCEGEDEQARPGPGLGVEGVDAVGAGLSWRHDAKALFRELCAAGPRVAGVHQ